MLNIYLTNLGLYNSGVLLGEWVELPITDEELNKVFDRIKICHDDVEYTDECGNPYEEYFITDYDCKIEGVEIHEYSNLNTLNELAEELSNLEEWELEEVEAILEVHGGTINEAIEAQQEGRYIYYSGRTIEELAEELADEQIACYTHEGKVPEFFTRYFDYEAFARDLEKDYCETSKGCITRY